MASQTQLDEANAALHTLLIGKRAAKLVQNGKSVEYQPADVDKLRNYITSLQKQLGATSNRRGPAGVF